jgi:RHS repeat-associated protein
MVALAEILTAEDKVKSPFARAGLRAGDNKIPNGTADSRWFGWQMMEERNPYGGSGSTDTPLKQYIWGSYIDECLQLNLLAVAGPQQLAVGVYYPLQDTLYRTMALVNSSGTPVEAYDTDAYGNTLIFTAADSSGNWWSDSAVQSSYGANDIIYCGYRYDAEAENYYVRNRYYSPVLGRWLTRDPIGYRGGINLYGYVDSSPVGNVDAEGLAGAVGGGGFSVNGFIQTILSLAHIKLISKIFFLKTQVHAKYQVGDRANIWVAAMGSFRGTSSNRPLNSYQLQFLYGYNLKTRGGLSLSSSFGEQVNSGASGPTTSAGLSLSQRLGNGGSIGAGATAIFGAEGYAYSSYQRFIESLGGVKTTVNLSERGGSPGPFTLSPSVAASLPVGETPFSVTGSARAYYFPGTGSVTGQVSAFIGARLNCRGLDWKSIPRSHIDIGIGLGYGIGSPGRGPMVPGEFPPGPTISLQLLGLN